MQELYTYHPIKERISAIVLLALGAYFFFVAGSFSHQAQMFPRLICGGIILCAIILFVRSFLRRPLPVAETVEDTDEAPITPVTGDRPVYLAVILTILYVVGTDTLGFMAAAALFIPIAAYCFGVRSWTWIAASTLIFVVGSNLLFTKVFYILLPAGIFPNF